MTDKDLAELRPVSASMGIMLETISDRLSQKGGPHYGSPDKSPDVRLDTIAAAGRLAIPFTTGLLIGIGETRAERIEALLAIQGLHQQYGHIQEVIIQNFDPKPGTKMAGAPPASEDELVWTIAVARLLLGSDIHVQTPPNLNAGRLRKLVDAGISDWGGVSPVTPDYVNPNKAWPELERLRLETDAAGKILTERLTIYPCFALNAQKWLDENCQSETLRLQISDGYARPDTWEAGVSIDPPDLGNYSSQTALSLDRSLARLGSRG